MGIYVYGPHFTLRCVCMYMVITIPCVVNVCIWTSLYFEMCMYVYGPHFTSRCECMYMVVTGIKYHYPNIPPNCMYIRYICLGQATTVFQRRRNRRVCTRA